MLDERPSLTTADELTPGRRHALREYELTTDDIVSYARQWDPLPMHVDLSAARESVFGGLVASGMHTLAILQRLSVDTVYRHWALVAGRRLAETRFIAPAREGMLLAGDLVIESVRPRPGRPAVVMNHSRLMHGADVLLELRVEVLVAQGRSSSSPGRAPTEAPRDHEPPT